MKNDLPLVKTSRRCFGVRVFNSMSGIQGRICCLMLGVGGGCFEGEKFLKEPELEETITFMGLPEPAGK